MLNLNLNPKLNYIFMDTRLKHNQNFGTRLMIGLMLISFSFTFSACGEKKEAETPEEKQALLASLKSEVLKLQEQILKLESELQSTEGKIGKLAKVKTGTVEPSVFKHYVEVQGKVDSDQNVMVSPKSGGVITKVWVKKGDVVTKGQLLVQIDDEMLRKSMDEVKTQLDLATTVYNRQKNLWDQKIGTEIQFLTAKANKESLEKRLITLDDQLEMAKVKAPFAGIVDEVIAREGEMAMPGMGVARVVNTANTKIVAELSEAYFTRIHTGDEVIVVFPDQQMQGSATVKVKSNAINAVNRTFSIEAGSPSFSGLVIRPNMIVEVKVKDYENKTAITIPLNLIQRDETTEFIYLAKKEGNQMRAEKRMVKTGMSYAGYIEILEGLEANESLVLVGYQSLVNGQPLEILQ